MDEDWTLMIGLISRSAFFWDAQEGGSQWSILEHLYFEICEQN